MCIGWIRMDTGSRVARVRGGVGYKLAEETGSELTRMDGIYHAVTKLGAAAVLRAPPRTGGACSAC